MICYIPSVADDDGNEVACALGQSMITVERFRLLLPLVLHSSQLTSRRRRFPGLGLVVVTDFGAFGTFTSVGTATGCRRFFRSFRNIIDSKCSEHTLQFLLRYSGDLLTKSSRRMLIAHLFALNTHK